MRTINWLFVSVLVTTPAAAQAQAESEEVRVLRAAAAFVRDSLVKTKVVIDEALYKRGSPMSEATAILVARQAGAERARLEDLLLCDGKPTGPWCRIKGGVAVISFSQPRIRGDAANVNAYFIHHSIEGNRLESIEVGFTLIKPMIGRWHVTETKTLGAS